jgi:hypothetical protein
MKKAISIKPQDVAILAKLIIQKKMSRQADIARDLGLSQGEIAKSLLRLHKAGLVINKNVNRSASVEFFVHAIKYIFPAEIGALAVGVPTAISAPAHKKMLVQSEAEIYVWPSILGKKRGQSIKPFYPKLAEAALKDEKFYEMMSAIEILRIGRARERKLAEEYLERKIKKIEN